MHPNRFVPLAFVASLTACDTTNYAVLCAKNDPSVSTAKCYDEAWALGRSNGYSDGYNTEYDDGLAECEPY